jgi:hypothetical protein
VTIPEGVTLAVGALLAAEAVRRMPRPAAGRRRRRRRVERTPLAPSDLRACERMLRLSTASAGETHHRLAPMLREIAAQRLAAGRRIDMGRDMEAARASVSSSTWELIRPDRPAPHDRHGNGPSLAELESAIAELEQLGRR